MNQESKHVAKVLISVCLTDIEYNLTRIVYNKQFIPVETEYGKKLESIKFQELRNKIIELQAQLKNIQL